MKKTVFLLPGLNNSGPGHWQSIWEKSFGFIRINQRDWDKPVCEEWITTLDNSLQTFPTESILLVAHSLACCTVAHWAGKYRRKIKGALLVAPSDVEAPTYPLGTTGFSPMPLLHLPFPSIVIASRNDYYVSLERAAIFAKKWGSRFVDIGALGHINSASNLGDWPEGRECLDSLSQD